MTTLNGITVLVTGITGYIGHHCVAELLLQGYTVRGSLRSLSKKSELISSLHTVSDRASEIQFFETDLLNDAGWEEAMAGCDYVLHVASPFIMGEPSNPDELIKPAVEGTQRVLSFAQKAGVKRLILTSSTVAVSSDMEEGIGGPDDWADPNKVGSYAKSKILAEKAAWTFIQSQEEDHKMEMVVINPGGVMGPTLTGTLTGTSVGMIHDMIKGKMPMIPNIAIGMVDVRDVAKIHVKSITVDEAVGKRFILASTDPVPMMKIAEILKSEGYNQVSTRKAPSFLLKFMALFNKDVKGMVTFLGRKVKSDNTLAKTLLNWQPTSIEDSIIDMAKSIKS
jgi:dihydroflavonol-4-reductase